LVRVFEQAHGQRTLDEPTAEREKERERDGATGGDRERASEPAPSWKFQPRRQAQLELPTTAQPTAKNRQPTTENREPSGFGVAAPLASSLFALPFASWCAMARLKNQSSSSFQTVCSERQSSTARDSCPVQSSQKLHSTPATAKEKQAAAAAAAAAEAAAAAAKQSKSSEQKAEREGQRQRGEEPK